MSEIGSHYIRSGKCRLNRSAFFIYTRNCFAVFKRQRYRIPLIWIKAALRAGRLKENHPRYAPVFSFAEPCSKREIQENGAYKTGKTSSRGPLSTHKIKEYETTTHRRHMQVNGHTRDEGRSNPAMSQRRNTVPRHPVPANSGRNHTVHGKDYLISGNSSRHSDPYRNVIINP